jgi:hypothetical protein
MRGICHSQQGCQNASDSLEHGDVYVIPERLEIYGVGTDTDRK